MSNRSSNWFAAAVRIVATAIIVVSGATIALAQLAPRPDKEPGSPPAARPNDKAPPIAPETGPPHKKQPGDATASASPKRGQLGKVIPDAPGERAKLLDDLYAHLATAANDDAAKPIAEAIERVWQTPGSDTILALVERAGKAANSQRNDLALQLLTAAVELAPDYAEGWNRRAYVFYAEGDYERAMGDLRRVLALDPNHFKALDGLGQLMRQLDRKAQALRVYEKLQAVHPAWPNIQTLVDELRRDVEGRAL
jgi:tetratricopeptide (TPR) repeat protein